MEKVDESPEGMIPVEKFAIENGETASSTIDGIREGRYVGRKVGDQWFVNPAGLRANTATSQSENGMASQNYSDSSKGIKIGFIALAIGAFALLIMLISLHGRYEEMSDRISSIEVVSNSTATEVALQRLIQNAESIAYLTPGDSGYGIIKTDIGSVTVSMSNIRAYANGSTLTLTFGNLSTAKILDPSAKVEWGRVGADGVADNQTQRSRDIRFEQKFEPGSWNEIRVVLDGIPMSELGFVRISEFRHKGIQLLR